MGQTGVSTQQTIMDPPILQISESATYHVSLEDLLSESTSSINLGGTGIQQSGGCIDSLCSDRHTLISAQQTIMDSPILQIPESIAHPLRLEDHLPERTSFVHLGGTGIQQSGGCTDSLCSDRHTLVSAQQTIMDSPILQIPESITHPLRLEDHLPERTSFVHLGGTGIHESGGCTDSLCSDQHTLVSAQQTIMDSPILQIPESIAHPLRLEDHFPERTSFVHLGGTGIQESDGCTDSLCSDRHSLVSAQQTIMDSPILQIPESIAHPLRLEDHLPERTSFEHLGGTGIQESGGCTDSLSYDRHTTVPAQRNLDSAMETPDPSRSQEDLTSERAPSECLRSTGPQLEQGNQLISNLMLMNWDPPQVFYADPFQNEISRIQKQNDSCSKKHEDKKVRLQYECELEIEKLRRKYNALCQDAERAHLRDKKMLQAIYEKVSLHKIFAEEVRPKFYDNKEGISTLFRGPSLNLSQQLQTPLPQAQLPFRPSSIPPSIPPLSTSSHPVTSTINQESTAPLLSAARSRTRLPSLPPNHLPGSSSHASPVFLSNTARGPSTPRASLQVGRLPAPHLQRFRPNAVIPSSSASHSPAIANHQPLSAGQVSVTAPLLDLGSILPPPLTSTQPSISPACWNSQPLSSRSSTLFSSSPMDPLTQDMEADLLESLLSNLPAMNNEVPTPSMVNVRSNDSLDIICLSDDE